MASQDQVIELNRLHPDWTARQIAEHLGAPSEYIAAVKHRNKLTIGRALPGRKKWTPEIVKAARKLLAERGVTDEVFVATLGFSKRAAYGKLYREGRPAIKYRAEGNSAPSIPEHVLADRDRRYSAPRSLTAILMGDPA